ncbi:hypothetical protein Thena_0836 [Thermodesulfobium narugense DSM 14796]|uniref:Glycosyltransferase RgtA/B/C/D-like domain-containing protein n=1 Tax=Thermodesulfobium narugense DSM 14796 TaxID=747365 RepID=M1E738_9BACT|nr:hypothetical protein [Thermodesulfobium narugense]AEE14468.1 hypothetical protein Thena_0836 [Thermodesulfobium narugense DSM 14796]
MKNKLISCFQKIKDFSSSLPLKAYKIYTFSSLILVAAAIIFYFYTSIKFSVNMPYSDDYDAILDFIIKFYTHNDFGYRLYLFFSQFHEHRIVFDRLITLFFFNIFGKIDFKILSIVGNFGLLFIILFLFIFFKKKYNLKISELLPVVIAMLSFSQWELMSNFPMASIQQYYELLFSIISITAFTCEGYGFIFGIVFFVIAVFTGGGGLFVSPVILLYLLLTRQYKRFSIFLIVSIIIFYIYFPLLHYISPPIKDTLIFCLKNPASLLGYMLIFIASAAKNYALIFILAILLVLNYLWILRRKLNKNNHSLILLISFIFLTSLVVGLNRIFLGFDSAMFSRYTMYSLFMFSLSYISLFLNAKVENDRKIIALFGFILAIVLYVSWVPTAYSELSDKQHMLNSLMSYPYQDKAFENIKFAKNQGWFTPQKNVYERTKREFYLAENIKQLRKYSAPPLLVLTYFNQYPFPFENKQYKLVINVYDSINLYGWAVDPFALNTASFLYADIDGKLYPLTYGFPRKDVVRLFKIPQFKFSGFNSNVSIKDLPNGKHEFSLIVVNHNETAYYQTNNITFYKEIHD